MTDVSQAIRDTARRLLAEGQVDVVIGFEAGTLPLRSSPCFVRDAGDTDRLVWNMSCENNLARYLPWIEERVGIVAKGCDARSIVGHLKEGRLERDRVFIIGVPCAGLIDLDKIEKLTGKDRDEIDDIGWAGDKAVVEARAVGRPVRASRCSRSTPR